MEPIEQRLAFERAETSESSAAEEPIQLASAVVKNLDQDELKFGQYYFGHAWALEQLHENAASHFARAAGFGIMRMPSVRSELVQRTPRRALDLPVPVALAPFSAEDPKFTKVHRTVAGRFIERDRVGYIRNRGEVAGFESHRLAELPGTELPDGRQNWQIVRLELVSLLRHDEPRVYVAESMPAMDQLEGVPTRALTEIEGRALPQLVSQKDVVVDVAENRIAMVGALRAATACLQCHEGERGKLLGAFSYELVPLPTAEEKTPTADDSMASR
jgi:hypothetical protein